MKTTTRSAFALVLGLAAVGACSEATTEGAATALEIEALRASLSATPVGYGDLASSYVGVTASAVPTSGALWLAGGREARFDGAGPGGGMMGGGLAEDFAGGMSFGRGRGHEGPFGGVFARGIGCAGAAFDAASGRVACPAETRNGLTINRSAQYLSAAGAVQQAFDTLTTNSVNTRSTVAGTVSYARDSSNARDGRGHGPGLGGRGPGARLLGDTATILTATTTVQSSSERTVAGLAQGSTQRTVNGASRGVESTTGTSSRGAFTASRTVGDTTRGVVVPVRAASDTARTYPTAGTVVRAMTATLTFAGQAATTVARREVVTYDGTATAKVVITENGTTRNCTRALPRGRLVCS
ncbi:hypothetical protein [Roseisolibacter sp. H3M3-2]|uniref:hypothetical protein n=1 Tax=Roseisolibacter sp. H3M3-2 TaxID=3031323 RepID=UPI0023DC9B5F|nr:hypothetical protein [Roseisolibacter sp. H3M3-2]MDF1504940.1 hypothetical protein [Roseisolibacter sp. H3M3-2]